MSENKQLNDTVPSALDAMIERLQNKPEDKIDQDLSRVVVSLLKGYEHLAAKLGVMAGMIETIDFNTKAVAGGIGTLVEFLDVKRIIRMDDLGAFERARMIDSDDTPDIAPDLRPTNQVST